MLVEDDDAGGEVREVDHPVDAGPAIRPRHLVVPDGDPGVVVRRAARPPDPRPDLNRGRFRDRSRLGVDPLGPGRRLGGAHDAHRRTARSAPRGQFRRSYPCRDARPHRSIPRSAGPRASRATGSAALYDVRIPVSDGLELSANLWLPQPRPDAPDERFPAILEMIPYRKDDWRLASDMARGEWLAARGFALCRLDVRGTGSSPGIALDEYTPRETQDGYDAVEWLAAQPWCNGNVGMWGISYGGFTSIQVAMLRPPHLKAIVPMMATDDRYTDDVHYIGGCVTVSELSQYAVSMVGMNAMPPKAEYRGAAWADEWRERLEKTPVWLFEWLRQQHDGPYWRQGSLAPDYGAIEAAIFSIGGWMDSYVDPVLRMQERCTAPRRSLIGNWVHSLPGRRLPGPEPRLAPRDGPLLRPLAEGHRQRRHGRAGPRLLPARIRRARAVPGGVAGRVAGARGIVPARPAPGELALTWRRAAAAGRRSGRGDGRRRAAGRRALPPPPDDRHPGGAVVGRRRRPERPRPRPAAGRVAHPDVHERRRWSSRSTSSASRRRSSPGSRARRSRPPSSGSWTSPPTGRRSQVTAGILNLTHRDSHASPVAARAGRRHGASGSRCARPPTDSCRATGSGFRSRRRTGRSSGRRRSAPSTGSISAARPSSRLILPDDPGRRWIAPGAAVQDDAGRAADVSGSSTDEPPTWRVTDDVIARDRDRDVRASSAKSVLPDGDVEPLHGRAARDDRRGRRPGARPDAQRGRLPRARRRRRDPDRGVRARSAAPRRTST